ncbi:MAG: hypothetical protein HPY57_13230 [Ignavibacteria bacterium]|nr:hypothetical protein [Ignavibacteria bacterium]
MITIKAFYKNKKGMYSNPTGRKKFYYKVGETYQVNRDEVEICFYGFHASANCDISETLFYYDVGHNTVYCLVDINVIETSKDKVVGDKITILRELTYDECVEYDKTGEWCFYAGLYGLIEPSKLEDAIIKLDKDGSLCYKFARSVKGANKEKLTNAVIKKDKTGDVCFELAGVEGVDRIKLLTVGFKKLLKNKSSKTTIISINGNEFKEVLKQLKQGKTNKRSMK